MSDHTSHCQPISIHVSAFLYNLPRVVAHRGGGFVFLVPEPGERPYTKESSTNQRGEARLRGPTCNTCISLDLRRLGGYAVMKVVNDGPLDAALYSAASVKVLYLLKQVNSTEGGWSLSQFVSEQVIDPTDGHVRAAFPVWLNLARWSYLAQQHGAPHFQDLSAHSRELSEALKSSAVVNLMNELGTATTDPQALLNGARQHRSGWLRQIEELSPKFIICGGTFWVLEQLDALPQTPVMTGPAGMRYSWSGAGPIYLDFVHPANRSSHAMMFAWLRETLLTLSKEIGTGGNRVS